MRSSTTILFFLASIVSGQVQTDSMTFKDYASDVRRFRNRDIKGVDDLEFYQKYANSFVGLNPVSGSGSGFIFRESSNSSMTGATFGNIDNSGGARNNLCTCECKPSASGIGCAGHAGINYRYGSLLWIDPTTGAWTGQTQALQQLADTTKELNFLGTDTRFSGGGAAIYNVACTSQDCGGLFAGVFRQFNDAVSCKAGLAEEALAESKSCFVRCGDTGVYKEWLEYCAADIDRSDDTGFSGYSV